MRRTGHGVLGFAGAVLISLLVWDQVESRSLAREIAAIAQRGEPTSVPDPEGVALTPEQREAARWYAGAAERATEVVRQDGSRAGRVDVDGVVPADVAALEARYPSNAPPLQMLDHATPMDFKEFGSEAPELSQSSSPLMDLLSLSDLRADLLSARGRGDDAARALVASARLMRTARSTFGRAQAAAHVMGSVRILLRHATPGEVPLADLQRAILELGDSDRQSADVQESRARFLDRLAEPAASPIEAIANRVMRPWYARQARARLDAFRDAIALAATPWPARAAAGRDYEARYLPLMQQGRVRPGFGPTILQPYGLPVVPLNVNQAGLEVATRRVITAALAVERFRRAHAEAPPAALPDLVPAYLTAVPVDPFTGRQLIYRATEDAYVLYSADVDGADNGGAFYGRGSRGQLMPRAGQPRDLGLRVERRR